MPTCNCRRRCGGTLTQVSHSTYRTHKKHRDNDAKADRALATGDYEDLILASSQPSARQRQPTSEPPVVSRLENLHTSGIDTTNSPQREAQRSLRATVEDADSDNEFADPSPAPNPRASTPLNSPPHRWSLMPSPNPGFRPNSPPHSLHSLPDEPESEYEDNPLPDSDQNPPPPLDADDEVLLNEI
ncbi:hypothetical protein JVU11DRAFT_12058 [Chiua virens]|nr:hypothetical protein JVU11DRAFT_12058 [Chiua virens]